MPYFTQTGATNDEILQPKSNRHKRVELWAKSIKDFVNLGRHFPRGIRKNPRSMYARVPQAMAQFVLKIEKMSHIMGPTPILEMARAYGLRPRLWLLTIFMTVAAKTVALNVVMFIVRFQISRFIASLLC